MEDGLTDEQYTLRAELITLECKVDMGDFADGDKAMMYVCMAHDHYQMDMDEEGNRLLMKAERAYPNYFKTLITEHTKSNPDFATLVNRLTIELAYMFLSKLNERIK